MSLLFATLGLWLSGNYAFILYIVIDIDKYFVVRTVQMTVNHTSKFFLPFFFSQNVCNSMVILPSGCKHR